MLLSLRGHRLLTRGSKSVSTSTTEGEWVDALREAAGRLGESPAQKQYVDLDVTPAASTIPRVVGGWNEAKERAR
ncbi:MAG: hypothetical protein V5A44_10225 [Haloarculaceae archaeon]